MQTVERSGQSGARQATRTAGSGSHSPRQHRPAAQMPRRDTAPIAMRSSGAAQPDVPVFERLGLHAGGAGFIGLIILLTYLVFIQPTRRQMQSLAEERERLILLTEAKPQIGETELQLFEQTQAYRKRLDRLVSSIPQSSNLSDLLQVLSTVAEETGVDVTAVRPQAESTGRLSQVQELSVELTCDFKTLCRFLMAVDQRPEWLWGCELVVQSTGRPTLEGDSELLSVRVYLQQPHQLKAGWQKLLTSLQRFESQDGADQREES